MQKLQDSVFSITKTTNLSPAVFSFLQPTDDFSDKTPLGGILNDTKLGWLALGSKLCIVDLRTGMKVAARTFGASLSNIRTTITAVCELPTPLTDNSQQLLVSLECEDLAGLICVFHINGSQVLKCIQTEVVVTELAVYDGIPDGPFTCFDGIVMAGSKNGEVFVFDLNRAGLIQALKDTSQGYDNLIRNEDNPANVTFLPLKSVKNIDSQRDLALENDDHIAVLLNENSLIDGQYIFRNPDNTIRMKANQDHVRVTVLQYIPQLASIAVGFNFGAFQIWNLINLELEFTSQVNVECLPVTHLGFQEPCDDPRAFCYLWVVFSVIDRYDEEEFPLAVMYSLTYQGKRMLSDTKCLYQDFLMATIRFQVELSSPDQDSQLVGGRCVSCHTYSINSLVGGEGEESMLNICQLVWEAWGEGANAPTQHGLLLFDLDQWYKDQMPATYQICSNAFMSATWCLLRAGARDVRLVAGSVAGHAARAPAKLEEHFYPNSLHYNCICLSTSEACVLSTIGIQRQIINSIDEVGPTALLNPTRLFNACVETGLTPLFMDVPRNATPEEQRRYLLSVALEARLSKFLTRCARDWATGSHSGAGCTLTFLVDWCWSRAIELKENACELTAPLFNSAAYPDRNVVRCLEHSVQQLTQLTSLLDSVLTKCCNLVVPDALSEMEEKHKGIGTVSLYFQVVQWFLCCGLLPPDACSLYPGEQLAATYATRRLKLRRLQEHSADEDKAATQPCPLLYIDQLIEHEFGGERIREMWIRGGSEWNGLYPPPSLYSLLRLYLLPDIAEEHKHSLVLYLLVDYSMVYDEVRYESVIRRLMQFPTMFGLSNTAIKATQAFWHLDHRDFDFALDQLQCLTGNTLSEWQHNVVLSSLLAQKKTQAALQYLHVRKPAPIQSIGDVERVSDDKLEDWQSCCNLYLARGLVFEALDVVRLAAQNVGVDEKVEILNFFFKGCRNSGLLSKVLQVTLLPFEEEVFIRYLENCRESQTSDILVMYYLQQARYLEAEQYNRTLKQSRPLSTSSESIADSIDRERARDTLVEVARCNMPAIAGVVADTRAHMHTEVYAPKPMSVFVQAKSPKNTFTYKSTFIQDTIQNASETWVNKPKMRKGLKRALKIEDTPFICTPKLSRTKSVFPETSSSTPAKRARMSHPHTPRVSAALGALLDMPHGDTPPRRDPRPDTPHSILKIKSDSMLARDSPTDSRYLADSDDEMRDTASNHTHFSDCTNKHLRFTIPTSSEAGSTPSPPARAHVAISTSEITTTEAHAMTEPSPLESPPKKFATTENVYIKKSYKDSVRARRSLSLSANSSLSDDPNTSIESIADIPITLINPRYSGERSERVRDTPSPEVRAGQTEVPTPRGRRCIRSANESTPLMHRDRSATPERYDSPMNTLRAARMTRERSVTPERQDSPINTLRATRMTRSRSRTPELSPRGSSLASIPEAALERDPAPRAASVPPALRPRSRSRTPERIDKVLESPRLEAILESPTKVIEVVPLSPARRSLRSRSRTPEVEVASDVTAPPSPRSLRPRAKTPEKLMSPKKEAPKSAKKSLSRLVLEANTFAKTKRNLELEEPTTEEQESSDVIEVTPMKALKPVPHLMDVTISPIASKSILQSSNESVLCETPKDDVSESTPGSKSTPVFTMNETKFGKSVLNSFDTTIAETTSEEPKTEATSKVFTEMKSVPAFTLSESLFDKSVLQSYQSSAAEASTFDETKSKIEIENRPASTSLNITEVNKSVLTSAQTSVIESSQDKAKPYKDVSSLMTSDSEIEQSDLQDRANFIQREKERIVEIEREITELENMSSDDEGGQVQLYSDSEEDDDEEEDMEEEEDSNEDDSESEDEEQSEGDVISIKDSDTDSSSDSDKLKIDEESQETPSEKQSDERLVIEVNVEIEEHKKVQDSVEDSTADPLNQGQVSIMTDDNSMIEDEEIILNYSDDNKDAEEMQKETEDVAMETEPVLEKPVEVQTSTEPLVAEVNKEKEEAPKDQVITITQEAGSSPVFKITESHNKADIPLETKVTEDKDNIIIEIKPTDDTEMKNIEEKIVKEDKNSEKVPESSKKEGHETEIVKTNIQESEKEISKSSKEVSEKETDKAKEIDVDKTKVDISSKEVHQKETNKANKEAEKDIDKTKVDDSEKEPVKDVSENTGKPMTRSRKRTPSTSSKADEAEPKTPMTRKRTQSIASNKSIDEQKTPESDKTSEISTPSTRRRAKTPTSTEVKKILTRRASKELSEKLDDSQSIDESLLTPKRRSTRSRSKTVDDNASVASGSSVKSTRSKASEDGGDVKRKGRKSVVATKPDLSVIPENIVEETPKEVNDEIMNEYSTSRRLTRHQKAVLESWLQPAPSRRTSSRASSRDEDSAFDVQTIDRITLLNKGDFEGLPDPYEQQSDLSPESIASDASKQLRSRRRAASEARSTPKAAKITRRVSVDVAGASPASPARGRRASFTRACEALHTPKGRRASTELKPDSQRASPSSPARRASTASNTSQPDTSKRTRKMSAIEESKNVQ